MEIFQKIFKDINNVSVLSGNLISSSQILKNYIFS